MSSKIFAIFVNYNFGPKLSQAVAKALKFSSVTGIVIVDNASRDDSIGLIKKLRHTKPLFIIENRTNRGFDRAVNIGVRKALTEGADYVIPLDTDLDFSHDFVIRLYNARGDIVAPVLKFKRQGQWVYDYGGRVNWFIGRTTHLETSKPLAIKQLAVSTGDRMTKYWIDFVSGGCTLIKKEVFEKIGFLDEKYFLYYGDTDFAIRARRAGFKVVVDPTTFMWHEISEHRLSVNKFKIGMTMQGNLVFIRKWVAWYFRPIAYLYFFALIGKIIYNVYLRTNVESFRSYRQLPK